MTTEIRFNNDRQGNVTFALVRDGQTVSGLTMNLATARAILRDMETAVMCSEMRLREELRGGK